MRKQARQTMGRIVVVPSRAAWIASCQIVRSVRRLQFAECGSHVRFDPFGSYMPMSAVQFGFHVYLGSGARTTAFRGFFAGDHFVPGPGLLVGGNHIISVAAISAELIDGG